MFHSSHLLQIDYAPPDLNENDWRRQLDNDYAFKMFNTIRLEGLLKQQSISDAFDLCATCRTVVTELQSIDFEYTYDTTALTASAIEGACKLCALVWRTYNRHCRTKSKHVRIERIGHILRINSSRNAVLSIVRQPGNDSFSSTDYQIGLVDMPEAGSAIHSGIYKHWLRDCDDNHREPLVQCRNISSNNPPTRLLDVGFNDSSIVYLRERKRLPTYEGDWVALSHQWGKGTYCTTRDNLERHIKGIPFQELPSTFKDAVKVTRALGKRYLWIDSLCVIQGKDGDFQDEAKRMETVYSGAYCVIAASSAIDHYSGFLKKRKAREYVGLKSQDGDEAPSFICENIDNFKTHVLDGGLNSRGWVLQEHALARRTLFFTEYQTYFECGCGVQCETSTKLSK